MKISAYILFMLITVGIMACINPYLPVLSALVRYSIAFILAIWTICFCIYIGDKK